MKKSKGLDKIKKMNPKVLGLFALIPIALIVIVVIAISSGSSGSPDSTIARYCNILVKGNYGDLLDIADMPDSPLMSKERINAAKPGFRERFIKDNIEATTCTYTLATEDTEKSSYKVVINENKTRTVDIKKDNNKVILDEVYFDANIYSPIGSTVTIAGVNISDYKIKDENKTQYNHLDHYVVTVLKDDTATVEASHPLFSAPAKTEFNKSLVFTFPSDFDANGDIATRGISILTESVSFQKGDLNAIKELFNESIPSMLSAAYEKKDLNEYSKYFVDGSTTSLANFDMSGVERLMDKGKMNFYNIAIVDDKTVILAVSYGYYKSNGSSVSALFRLVKDGGNWKIDKAAQTSADF